MSLSGRVSIVEGLSISDLYEIYTRSRLFGQELLIGFKLRLNKTAKRTSTGSLDRLPIVKYRAEGYRIFSSIIYSEKPSFSEFKNLRSEQGRYFCRFLNVLLQKTLERFVE